MRLILSAVTALSLFAAAACSPETGQAPTEVAPILTSEEAQDEFSFAQPQVARVTHVALDLSLDFAARDIGGTATLDVVAADGAREVVLDSNGLRIESVADSAGDALAWQIGETVEGKGAPLTIALPEADTDAPRRIVITYKSAPEAEALQWLAPEQTAGRQHPFLFSQGQAINNRTWIPTQDSPGIRQTWEARITAPDTLKVVMSGIIQGDAEDAGANDKGEGLHTFAFKMDRPVAPYLIAIAAGNIEFHELGPRTGVWAEPETMPAAAAELVDTEAMVDAAEGLYGQYRWGRYDMIVLPPSFPYGGMENPVMTFLTPTFIAGDRSLTGLVAHELAHSWSGNLVTYASWRDGWLNEGVTSYIENRISEVVFGTERAAQERALSFAGVEQAVEEQGADAPGTALRVPAGTDPMEQDSAITYDKGALFLHTVESIVGRDKFDAWLKSWFDGHAFQPATSAMFLEDLRANLIKGDAELEQKLMLDEWVYGTGLPANAVRPDPAVFAAVDRAVASYAASGAIPFEAWGGWSTAERMRFMQEVPQQRDAQQLAALDRALGLSTTGNNEVRFLWLRLALGNKYDPAIPQAQQFLSSVGRNKFVAPLYRAMMDQGAWGSAIARPLYESARSSYHAFTRGNVDEIVGWQAGT
jgi:leukotriene-A4 hydrolase